MPLLPCFSAKSNINKFSTNPSIVSVNPDVVSKRIFGKDKRPVILFDGICNMCNSAVNLALDLDSRGKFRFSALQSNVGRALLEVNGREPDDISSMVLVTEDESFIKSDAVLRIAEEIFPRSPIP